VTGSVSSRTSYLIIGSVLEDGRKVETGNKYKKASDLKISILNETALEEFLQKATKNPKLTLLTAKSIIIDGNQASGTTPAQQKPADDIIKQRSQENGTNKLWADKYAPQSTTEIIGNTATINKLKEWVHDWEKVVIQGQKKPIVFRPGMNRENIANVNARACLLSGPPGIGKSTAAVLCAKELGFEPIETNASDQRNKKIIETLLASAVESESITQYASGQDKERLKFGDKTIIIMDEVDGCSGNNDRGGIQTLIKIIKTTKTPIICICNDRMSTKVRSLAGHCYDLKFIRPQNATIKARMKMVLAAEKVQMDDNALELLIESSGNDIRQMINTLQLHSTNKTSMTYMQAKNQLKSMSKDENSMVNPFEAVTKLLTSKDARELKIWQKMSLYFIDFELTPLLVHENYITSYGDNKTLKDLNDLAESADYISQGDCLNRTLREENEWTLLPDVGLCSTVAPTTISARIPLFVKFPAWFGKNSSTKKTSRLVHELASSLAGKVCVPRMDLLNDIIPCILREVLRALKEEGIEKAIQVLNSFNITLDQFKENMLDLCENSKGAQMFLSLDTSTKSGLTRAYNKIHPHDIVIKKKKKTDAEGGDEEMKDRIDPDREEVPAKNSQESEQGEEESSDEEIIIKTKTTKGSTKKTKKETKKEKKPKESKKDSKKEGKKETKKRGKKSKKEEDEEMSESMKDFIVDDDEEI